MARASKATLAELAGLLERVRSIAGLTEKNAGIFYWKREPMLHFHDNGGNVVAHLKAAEGGFDEFAVDTASAQAKLVAELMRRCAARRK